ncbi:MAG: S8 family serine peptidase [Phycisphaerales bacterium JB043]
MSSNPVRNRTSLTRALLASAAIASSSISANAVTEERFFLFWADWESFGALGSDVVVGQIDGGLPNLDHEAWEGEFILPITYPLPTDPNSVLGDPLWDRHFFFTSHATAALGAIGARNIGLGTSPLGAIQGWAPEVKMIVGGIGSDRNPDTGAIFGDDPNALLFTLFMMTDQDFADAAIGNYVGYWQDFIDRHTDPFTGPDPTAEALHPNFYTAQPYRVATVVNLPFARGGNLNANAGGSIRAQLVNIAAAMTPATFVAAAGNEGEEQNANDELPAGTVGAPASAPNVIAVGFTETGRLGQLDDFSSRGPSIFRDRRFDGQLLTNPEVQSFDPIPNEPLLPEVRAGIDIVAPADELELPGSFILDPLNNTAFIKGWTGSSMSSSIVAGAIAQLHDLHRKRYFNDNPDDPDGEFSQRAILPSVVTRAILLNSATREQGFRNSTTPSVEENDALITTQPIDSRLGAGRLDMRRLLNQYLSTPSLGGFQDLDDDGTDNDGAEIFAFRRDPSIVDAASLLLENQNDYLITDLNNVPVLFQGTDPTLAAVSFWRNPADQGGRPGGGLSSITPARSKHTDEQRELHPLRKDGRIYTPIKEAQLIPPGSDVDLGGVETGGGISGPGSSSNGLTSGESSGIGGTGAAAGTVSIGTTVNPNAPSGVLYLSGWDHGMLGTGLLNIPMGLITEGSTISVTLTWNERQILDQRLIDNIRDSIDPANLRATSDALLGDLNHLAYTRGVDVPEPGTEEANRLLYPEAYSNKRDAGRKILESLTDIEPTVMSGYSVNPITPPPGFDPAENDDPNAFFDFDTNIGRVDKLSNGTLNPPTSPFRGVCYINARVAGQDLSFTGVAIGPRHVLTAAHNFDINDDGLSGLEKPLNNLSVTFRGIDTDNDGTGETLTYTRLAKNVEVHPSYIGIGVDPVPGGFNRGFANDLAIITLDLEDGVDDFDEVGIPFYTISTFTQNIKFPGFNPPGFPENPPFELLMVGYGASGFGDVGVNAASYPENGFVRRLGWNQIASPDSVIFGSGSSSMFMQVYLYDFDGPPLIYGAGFLNDGLTLGNKLESIHTAGDSGGPVFEWFDSGDGMGGLPDGKIQTAELRIFGLNTARANGISDSIETFGAVGIGVILNSYASTSMDNWINETINAPPDPPLPGTPGAFINFDPDTGLIVDGISWEFENLDLELYADPTDGGGFRLIAASRGEFYNTELIYLQNETELVRLGNYFTRIVYAGSNWDFGGFLFGSDASPSNPRANGRGVPYENNFNADTEYGLAFYVELVRDVNIFGLRSGSARSVDGSFTAIEEPYYKVRFEDLLGDMNGDTDIDGADLGELLALWGDRGIPGQTRGDLDKSGVVDAGDLAVLLRNYTGFRR